MAQDPEHPIGCARSRSILKREKSPEPRANENKASAKKTLVAAGVHHRGAGTPADASHVTALIPEGWVGRRPGDSGGADASAASGGTSFRLTDSPTRRVTSEAQLPPGRAKWPLRPPRDDLFGGRSGPRDPPPPRMGVTVMASDLPGGAAPDPSYSFRYSPHKRGHLKNRAKCLWTWVRRWAGFEPAASSSETGQALTYKKGQFTGSAQVTDPRSASWENRVRRQPERKGLRSLFRSPEIRARPQSAGLPVSQAGRIGGGDQQTRFPGYAPTGIRGTGQGCYVGPWEDRKLGRRFRGRPANSGGRLRLKREE